MADDNQERAFQQTVATWEAMKWRERNILSIPRYFFHAGYDANSQLVTALVEALQPFAALDYNDTWAVIAGDPPLVGCSLRLSDIDTARAALALLNPPLTQLPLEHTALKAEREDAL